MRKSLVKLQRCIHLKTISCCCRNNFKLILRLINSVCYCCSVTKLCLTLWTPMNCSTPGLLKLIFIELIMPSHHLILCCPLLLILSFFPSIRVFANEFWLLTSCNQSIGISASASFLTMNIQDWFSLGLTGWFSLQSKGLSRVFSYTTVQKHQFFDAQLSLWFNSHTHTWPLEKPWLCGPLSAKWCLCFLVHCLGLS